MKIKVTVEKEIEKCYHECPYFELDGGPGPVMVCGHPVFEGIAWGGFGIITHPECDDGFPKSCPLLENSKMTEREMFEISFKRPKNFFKLSIRQQWEIDKKLGILDWMGEDLDKNDLKRFNEYYER